METDLRQYLLKLGATVVGFGQMRDALDEDTSHLRIAISIGIGRRLNEDTVSLLSGLQKSAAAILKSEGHRYLIIPPDSDRINSTYVSKLYDAVSHKAAATCAGLGWVGRNGLLINPEFGPRLTFTTVLTDAPLVATAPISSSGCGECRLCVEHCPAQAISGLEWSRENPFPELVDLNKCRSHQKDSRVTSNKPNCGLCIHICPYGRKDSNTGNEVAGYAVNNDLEEDRCPSIK